MEKKIQITLVLSPNLAERMDDARGRFWAALPWVPGTARLSMSGTHRVMLRLALEYMSLLSDEELRAAWKRTLE